MLIIPFWMFVVVEWLWCNFALIVWEVCVVFFFLGLLFSQ